MRSTPADRHAAPASPRRTRIAQRPRALHAQTDIVVANVSEDDLAILYNPEATDPNGIREMIAAVEEAARVNEAEVAVVRAQLEAELAELEEEDAREYLSSLGVGDTGLSRFIAAAYRELGLLTFFTSGEKESRAWTIRRGRARPRRRAPFTPISSAALSRRGHAVRAPGGGRERSTGQGARIHAIGRERLRHARGRRRVLPLQRVITPPQGACLPGPRFRSAPNR